MRYSLAGLIANAATGNRRWKPLWREPEPKASYDVVIVGGGGHGLATAHYLAKEHGIPVLIDGCQAVPHQAVDVRALDCDFYVFSGHKLYGPTGIGVLYGKAQLLQAMPPWQGGGDMIRSVTFERTEYNELPWKFEAGTPHIIGAVGLGAAIDYVQSIGYDAIGPHEGALLAYALRELSKISSLRLIGQPLHRLKRGPVG